MRRIEAHDREAHVFVKIWSMMLALLRARLSQCSPKPRHFLGRRKTKASDIRHFKTCRKILSCQKRNVPITLNVNVRIATDHGKKRIIKGRLSLEILSSNYFPGRRLCCRSSLYHQSITINLMHSKIGYLKPQLPCWTVNNWGEHQRAPQSGVELEICHSRYIYIYIYIYIS